MSNLQCINYRCPNPPAKDSQGGAFCESCDSKLQYKTKKDYIKRYKQMMPEAVETKTAKDFIIEDLESDKFRFGDSDEKIEILKDCLLILLDKEF